MATVVSIPSIISSGLRCVKFVFDMPDVGTPPERKYFLYRLKNVTDNTYLTGWETYQPMSNGQDISIDFYKDLFGILETPAPPYSNPLTLISNSKVVKEILVEYKELTVNSETCEETESAVAETNSVDVYNGIHRIYGTAINSTGQILSHRPKQYTINQNTYDWMYVTGTMNVIIQFLNATNGLLSTTSFNTTESHPGSACYAIPCGMQLAPTGTAKIRVLASATNPFPDSTDLAWVASVETCNCENGEPVDLYVQNADGGIDPLSMDCVDSKVMNAAKQEIISKFDCGGIGNAINGQRKSINNTSLPILTFRKAFNELSFQDSKWLDELVASGSAWIRDENDKGVKAIYRFQFTNGSIPTYGSQDTEVTISGYYSEVFLFPY